jgi:hypothetical protein
MWTVQKYSDAKTVQKCYHPDLTSLSAQHASGSSIPFYCHHM